MCSSMLDSIARRATPMAFLIARGEERPCEMMLIPFTPRRGAPP